MAMTQTRWKEKAEKVVRNYQNIVHTLERLQTSRPETAPPETDDLMLRSILLTSLAAGALRQILASPRWRRPK